MNKVICIVGPTASGKTKLAVALAQRIGGEIVSADSMQIYRYMNIGTAKPSVEEQGGIPHHMLDFLDPQFEYSAAAYCQDACQCIDGIFQRHKIPIIAGGTGLYIDTLVGTVSFDDDLACDNAIRTRLWQLFETEGVDVLFEKLQSIDPESAKTIHKNNVKRVIRAIEVYDATGQTMSERIRIAKSRPPRYETLTIGLTTSTRDILYGRINSRVDAMMAAGLEQEARAIFTRPLGMTARQAIGYKELFDFFQGLVSLEDAVAQIKLDTRRYAKRQLTWFKRNPQTHWLFFDKNVNFHLILEKSTELLQSYGII